MGDVVNDDDAGELAAARGGDHEAFARLYARHGAVVLSLCRRLDGFDPWAAEDALQETFVRAYRMLDQLDRPAAPERNAGAAPAADGGSAGGGSANFRGWLYAIARRVCAERRRAARRRAHHEGAAMVNATLSHEMTAMAPAAVVEQRERLVVLERALNRLSDRERLAIHLHYLDADPVAAATDVLRISRSGYYKLLARARERLALLMQEVQTT
jgi:RNA polymerase sigma-70 factor (ECF subfamily)